MNQLEIPDLALSDEDIINKRHRELVGGLWDEIGQLQLKFLKEEGLLPTDKFLDIGCGALRGGVNFISYLDGGNYYGIDINSSLIFAGHHELKGAGLEAKGAHFLVNGDFDFQNFGVRFEFAIAHSVFTHLPIEEFSKCLLKIKQVLVPTGEFYISFFEAPTPIYTEPLFHKRSGVTTYWNHEPYHFHVEDINKIAASAGMLLRYIGNWGHPRGQKMISFRHAD